MNQLDLILAGAAELQRDDREAFAVWTAKQMATRVIVAVEPLIRADERERLARSAAQVTITRADDGALSFSVDDPHGVGWVPVSLSLIPTLAAQSRAMFDLRTRVEALRAQHGPGRAHDHAYTYPCSRCDALEEVLALLDGGQ